MSFLDFKAKNLPADLTSGAVSALVAIPDAIASAFLAGVNPTYGFNALMTGVAVLVILGQLGDLTGYDSEVGKTASPPDQNAPALEDEEEV